MRLNKLGLASAALFVAIGLAACDGSENDRTIPTAGPDYQPPALVGPEVPEGEHGSDTESSNESEGVDPNATVEAK